VIIIPEAHMSAGENVIAATAADVAAAATRVRIAYSVCACKSIILYRNIAATHARISPVNHFGKSS